jgi:hypothetical protein
MNIKMAKSFAILAILVSLLAVSGCFSFAGQPVASPTPVAGTPTPPGSATPLPPGVTPTAFPGFDIPPGTTWIWTPGGDGAADNYTQIFPTPTPENNGTNGTVSPTPTPSSTPTPLPIVSATTNEWGTSKDTYPRGDTATGWVYVTNTGNVPITALDFTIVIKRTIFFVPVERSFDYSKTALNILPGQRQRVEFSQSIPAEYSGMSTAGDYTFTVTAKLAGNNIGSFSKAIKVT